MAQIYVVEGSSLYTKICFVASRMICLLIYTYISDNVLSHVAAHASSSESMQHNHKTVLFHPSGQWWSRQSSAHLGCKQQCSSAHLHRSQGLGLSELVYFIALNCLNDNVDREDEKDMRVKKESFTVKKSVSWGMLVICYRVP